MDMIKAANSAARSAKDISNQLEYWAKEGYGSAREAVKTGPFLWGAASLGFGAIMGGIYALWRRNGKAERRPARTMPMRAKQTQRTKGSGAAKKISKRTRRTRHAANS